MSNDGSQAESEEEHFEDFSFVSSGNHPRRGKINMYKLLRVNEMTIIVQFSADFFFGLDEVDLSGIMERNIQNIMQRNCLTCLLELRRAHSKEIF